MDKNILLTGTPRVGKTTLVKRVVEGTRERGAGGFYTEEIRDRGDRIGFKILTLDGREGLLAHVSHKSRFRVGRYHVNIKDLEDIAVRSILDSLDKKLIVIQPGTLSQVPEASLSYFPGYYSLLSFSLKLYFFFQLFYPFVVGDCLL